jgi:hypothetical protein
MAINNYTSQSLTGNPSRREPKKTGRKYGSVGLTYPIDMGIDATTEMDNHVIFDIYFDESTSFTSLQGTSAEPKAWKGHSSILGNKVSQAFNNAGDLVTENSPQAVRDIANNEVLQPALESAGKFVSGAFAGAQNLKRLNAQIALSVPNTFVATSTANYTEAKMGAVAGMLARMGSGNMAGQDIANLGGQAARLAMETFAALPDAFGMNLQNIMEVSTRRVSNPHIEQRFESVSFREFSFVYEFAARSKAEQEAIENIIKTFRFHMHPELIPSGLFFDYPSLFDISVMFKENENRFIHKISTCYLTSFTTNYTSTGVFATNRDGQPTEIQCTMNFREIEPLHKHRIEEGY